MEKVRLNILTIATLFISVALHGVIIGGILYASGMTNSGRKKVVVIKSSQTIAERYKLLPDVEMISNVSTLKNSADKSSENVKKDDFGTKKENASFDGTAEADVLMYQDVVKHKIQEARIYPEEARKEGAQGAVGVDFVILADGRLDSVIVTKSSGKTTLDTEAVSTIKRASPFPSFSGAVKNDKMEIQVSIIFKLN